MNEVFYPPMTKPEIEEMMYHLPDSSMTKKRLQGMINAWRYQGKW